MTADELRDLCLSFMGTEETFPFSPGTSVFKVAGKVFALAALDAEPLAVSLKCDPGLAEQLRSAHSAITPGYHLNKRHWNTVLLDGSLEDQVVADMVEDSYDLVVSRLPKVRQRGLLWRGAESAWLLLALALALGRAALGSRGQRRTSSQHGQSHLPALVCRRWGSLRDGCVHTERHYGKRVRRGASVKKETLSVLNQKSRRLANALATWRLLPGEARRGSWSAA